MELVVDANVIISILVSPTGKTCNLFFSDKLKVHAPEYLLEEIKKHKEEILDKTSLSETNFDSVLLIVSLNIEFIPFNEFKGFIKESTKICPDPNDVEYFALSLKLKCPFWSNDKKLKGQGIVKVLSTSELLKMF